MTFGPVTVVRPGATAVIGVVGPRGAQGIPGTNGATGSVGPAVWLPATVWASGQTYASGPPASFVAQSGGSYVCIVPHTSGVFATDFTNGLWVQVAAPGVIGATGTPGSTWYSGTGTPSSSIGINGDYYFETDTWDIYLRVTGAWGSPISNVKGAAGNTILNGSGAPSNGLGVNGDFYIDIAAFNIYGPKSGGVWGASTSLVGPSGPGTGDASGPAGGTKAGQVAVFAGTTGKLLAGAIRVAVGDANATIAASTAVEALTAALTTPRTWTLPAANALAAGAKLTIPDEFGGISATNTLTIARAGSDTINGGTSFVMTGPRSVLVLESDGTSKWTIVSSTNVFGYTTVGDTNYTVLATDRTVATSAVFTGSRTWTLPAAAGVPAGQPIRVTDAAGAISPTNTLTLARASADTINGLTSQAFGSTYSEIWLVSDGVSKWTYDVQGIARGGTGAVTAAAALVNLGAAAKTTTDYLLCISM